MTSEARKLWSSALRSGKYSQGTNYLNKKGSYCCLGVACDLYNKHVAPLDIQPCPHREDVVLYDGQGSGCPEAVKKWLDITSLGDLTEEEDSRSLAGLNDGGMSFAEIADVIDRGYLESFIERLLLTVHGRRKLWAIALRSGEYKQGQGALQQNGKFCCLGVACDLYQKYVGGLAESGESNYICYNGCGGFLPHQVCEWLDITEDGRLTMGVAVGCPTYTSLYLMNDGGASFNHIADVIESRNLLSFTAATLGCACSICVPQAHP